MNFMKNIINRISLFILLFKTDMKKYPIFDIFLQSNSIYKINNQKNLSNLLTDTLSFKSFNVDFFENKDELLKNFTKFAKTEKVYIKNKHKKEKILPELSLVLQILIDARDAIEKLKLINKSNKKIAYYESSKNSNLDKLIEHFTKKLNLKGEDKISFEISKREIKLKRFIVRLKKRHPLFLNYQLVLFKSFDITKIKTSKNEQQLLNGLNQILEFFTLGHATEQQIYRSIAIQVYYLYINKLTHTDLIKIIGNIIDIVFETEYPYRNFEAFNQEQAFIKNRVANFILFDLNDEIKTQQAQKIHKYIEKNIIQQSRFYRLNFMKNLIHKMVYNPLHFTLYMEQIKTFGFTPIKK